MDLRDIQIGKLHVSKLNMRHARKAPDIDDIYPSIKKSGVHQTLLVRKEGKGFGVIAGRRRLFALRKLAKETGETLTAPCGIMQSGDDALAIEASMLENMARLPTDEFQQYDAFAKLASKGQPIAEIAETFGITELKVRRVLALANLKPDIKQLFEAEDIGVHTLRALTLATHEQQDMWLVLYHDEDEHEPQGEQLKAWLTGGARIQTSVALFDLDAYDGTIISDLFGDTDFFADPDLFWTQQNSAIAAQVEALETDGWQNVTLLERGDQFCSWEHGKRCQADGGKVFVETRHDGSVKFHEGFLANSDIKKIDAILGSGEKGADGAPKTVKPEMSGPLADYVALHRHAAIRSCVLDHPMVALRLTVAHILCGSDLWTVAPEKTTSRKETTTASVAASVGAVRFEAERSAVFDLLGLTEEKSNYCPSKKIAQDHVSDVFAKLIGVDDETVLRTMTLAMAASLKAGSSIIEAIPHTIPVDMQALWKPDDAFFALLRDKRVLNAMVAEISSPATAKAHLTDTSKTQKEIVTNRIAGHGADARADWRPRWMREQPSSYLKGKGCELERQSLDAATKLAPKKTTSKKAA